MYNGAAILLHSLQQWHDSGLTFASKHAVDRATGVRDDGISDEGGAVAAYAHERALQDLSGRLRKVEYLRHVRKIVARKGDDIRPPGCEKAKEVTVCLDLQIDQPHVVTQALRRGCDELHAEGLEPKEDLRIHQRPGVDAENSHDWSLGMSDLRPRRIPASNFRSRMQRHQRLPVGLDLKY
jgi:hypothetical protein